MNEERFNETFERLIRDVGEDIRTFRFRTGTGAPPTHDQAGEPFTDGQETVESLGEIYPGEHWVVGDPVDPTYERTTNARELVGNALVVHEERDRICEMLDAGHFGIRTMDPGPDWNPDDFSWDDAFFQLYVDDGDEFIQILKVPATGIGHYVDVPGS